MAKVKRFLVWQGDTFYPNGPVADLVGSFASMEEARSAAMSGHSSLSKIEPSDWFRILDTDTGDWFRGGERMSEIYGEASPSDDDMKWIPVDDDEKLLRLRSNGDPAD